MDGVYYLEPRSVCVYQHRSVQRWWHHIDRALKSGSEKRRDNSRVVGRHLDVADAGTHLADVDLATSSSAAASVLILDKALEQISSSQAKLGAIQNRLQHNIDNLSMASMLTETARGRVVDADFARETSELSKQQILGQAATSMLAQANQSKQSVLALLQ